MKKERVNVIAKEIQLENSDILGPVIFHGQSMSPFLEDGDELTVIRAEWGEIKVGDIVTYRLVDKFPTYRVIKKMEHKLVLKPDNWMLLCEVERQDVLGKVIRRRRGDSSLLHTDWRWTICAKRVLFENWKRDIMSRIRYSFRRIRDF
ncbi:MAG: S24/S26 family peptidase [Thermodesulfobacteriota bacterium]